MKTALTFVALAAIGCGAQISDGPRLSGADAGGQADPDSDPDPDPDPVANPDAPPVSTCSNGRVVYLAFEGVQLKSTQVKSDATLNAAAWAPGTLNVPPYHATAATRANDAVEVTNAVRAALAMFPVTVVTTRPAAGPYMLIAFGGRSTVDFGFADEYYAYQTLDCGDVWPSDVAWVSDITPTNSFAAIAALGAIGWGLGLSGTTDPNNCLCGWGTECNSPTTGTCTFSTTSAVQDFCNNNTPITQNELAAIDSGFCKPR